MKWMARKYCKNMKRHLLISFCIIFLMSSCVPQYHIVTNPVAYQPETPYVSFTIMTAKVEAPHNSIINLLTTGLEDNLKAIGLRKDSFDSELLFIIRWETHLISRHSSPSNKEVKQTHSITNPVYSSYDNTSDGLKNNSPKDKIRYCEDSFYRVQAIDATKNELVWSVKIHPRKFRGLRQQSIPQVVRDLTRSFEQVQFNNSKFKGNGNYHN